MDCEKTREELSAYLDGEMEPGEAELLERHLEGCKPCSAELESLRATVGLVRSLPKVEAPAALRGRVFSAVARRPGRVRLPGAFALLTAAALVLVAVVATFMLADRQRPHVETETAEGLESPGKPGRVESKDKTESIRKKSAPADEYKADRAGEETMPEHMGKSGYESKLGDARAKGSNSLQAKHPSRRVRKEESPAEIPSPGAPEPELAEGAMESLPRDRMKQKIQEALRNNSRLEELDKKQEEKHVEKELPEKKHDENSASNKMEIFLVETRNIETAKEALEKLISRHGGAIERSIIAAEKLNERGWSENENRPIELVISLDDKEYAEFLHALGALEKVSLQPDSGGGAPAQQKAMRTPTKEGSRGGSGGQSQEPEAPNEKLEESKNQPAAPKPRPAAPAAQPELTERKEKDKDSEKNDSPSPESAQAFGNSEQSAPRRIKIMIVTANVPETKLMKVRRLSEETKPSLGK